MDVFDAKKQKLQYHGVEQAPIVRQAKAIDKAKERVEERCKLNKEKVEQRIEKFQTKLDTRIEKLDNKAKQDIQKRTARQFAKAKKDDQPKVKKPRKSKAKVE